MVVIVDEFMVKWCCCYEMLLLLTYAMGIHNYGVVVRFELFLKVLWKMGELMICVGMVFDFMFDVVLIAFLSSQTYKQTLRTNLGKKKMVWTHKSSFRTGDCSLEANGSLTAFLVLMFRASGVHPGNSKLILLM